jgi:hypothetical protein
MFCKAAAERTARGCEEGTLWGSGECGEEFVSMLDVVWSSGVVGLSGCRPPNWEPNDKDGRSERLGVGNLGLVLLLV